ncbi:MAG TPA: hypothetical protein VMO76_11945 [Candidatus Udaeobacter sp.]|nr:hypothetical protein [Candidatus Udaeobacter sp.]
MVREVMAIVESARHLLLFDNQKKEDLEHRSPFAPQADPSGDRGDTQ